MALLYSETLVISTEGVRADLAGDTIASITINRIDGRMDRTVTLRTGYGHAMMIPFQTLKFLVEETEKAITKFLQE